MDSKKTYQRAYQARYKSTVAVIKVTVDHALHGKLSRLAKRENKKMAALVRSILRGAVTDEAFVPLAVETELRSLTRLVRNVANNLNQLAHHSNVVKRVLYEDAVLAELRKLEKHVADYTMGRLRASHDP